MFAAGQLAPCLRQTQKSTGYSGCPMKKRLSQRTPEEWLQLLDETLLRPGLLVRPSDFAPAAVECDSSMRGVSRPSAERKPEDGSPDARLLYSSETRRSSCAGS